MHLKLGMLPTTMNVNTGAYGVAGLGAQVKGGTTDLRDLYRILLS